MKPKHQRLTLALAALATVIGAGLLAVSALSDRAAYFYSPADLAKAKPAPKRKPAAAKQVPTAPAKPVEKSAGAAMPKSSNRRSRS